MTLLLTMISSQTMAANFLSYTTEEISRATTCDIFERKWGKEAEDDLMFSISVWSGNNSATCDRWDQNLTSVEYDKNALRNFFAPAKKDDMGLTKLEIKDRYGEPNDDYGNEYSYEDERREMYVTFYFRGGRVDRTIIEFY